MVEEGGRCIQSTLRWKARNEHTKKFARKATIYTTEQHNRSIWGQSSHMRECNGKKLSAQIRKCRVTNVLAPHICAWGARICTQTRRIRG